MISEIILYEKLKLILQYLEDEIRIPLDNHNYDTRLWSKGYRKGLIRVQTYI